MTRILSLSYGKDSLACLGACKLLGYPIDRVIHAEVWATQDIPADLPPMVEFKKKADRIIKERYGLTVEHISAQRERERERERLDYESIFYSVFTKGKNIGRIYGFPIQRGQWCTSDLKTKVLNRIAKGHLRADVLPRSNSEEPGEARHDKRFSGSASIEVVCETETTVFS